MRQRRGIKTEAQQLINLKEHFLFCLHILLLTYVRAPHLGLFSALEVGCK